MKQDLNETLVISPEPRKTITQLHLGRCQVLTVDELDMTGSCSSLAPPTHRLCTTLQIHPPHNRQ